MDNTYSISEVAEKLDLSDKTLRRWEEAGRFRSPRTLGGQRRYTIEDLQILDAIKHGSIPDQKDLLTKEQAALVIGVSPATIDRYVAEGKIHPFITVGETYFPHHQLIAKLGGVTPPTPPAPPTPPPTPPSPSLIPHPSRWNLESKIWNLIITLLVVTLYHLFFNISSPPLSPTPSVQGASTINPAILNLVEDVLDSNGGITSTSVTAKLGVSSPSLSLIPGSVPNSALPGTLYYDATSQTLKLFNGNAWSSPNSNSIWNQILPPAHRQLPAQVPAISKYLCTIIAICTLAAPPLSKPLFILQPSSWSFLEHTWSSATPREIASQELELSKVLASSPSIASQRVQRSISMAN